MNIYTWPSSQDDKGTINHIPLEYSSVHLVTCEYSGLPLLVTLMMEKRSREVEMFRQVAKHVSS